MKLFSLPRLASLLAVVLCAALPLAARAQDPSPEPSATPIRPRPTPKPTPDPSLPAGTVNGQPIYRPLMKSVVADPINRALVLMDFARKGLKVSPRLVDDAVEDYRQTQFKGSDAKLDARLHELGATRDDFRQYVAEEIKLRTMLHNVTSNSVSDHAADRMRADYLANLRAHATINSPRT